MQHCVPECQVSVSVNVCTDRFEPYRVIIARVMQQNRLGTGYVAREIGVDRSYLGRVRRGERMLSARLLDKLVVFLDLDRQRLALAVEVVGDAELYFDPAFGNVCYYAERVVADLVALLQVASLVDRAAYFASLSQSGCDGLARSAIRHLDERLAQLDRLADPDRVFGEG